MNARKNFTQIFKEDKRVRYLMGGMLVDGLVLTMLVILIGAMFAI
ncbi:MAG: hypothetical protein NT082_04025 [Chloroflexi bacterium]|nr:hypothetical protein [Chloroflexota bacterium]